MVTGVLGEFDRMGTGMIDEGPAVRADRTMSGVFNTLTRAESGLIGTRVIGGLHRSQPVADGRRSMISRIDGGCRHGAHGGVR